MIVEIKDNEKPKVRGHDLEQGEVYKKYGVTDLFIGSGEGYLNLNTGEHVVEEYMSLEEYSMEIWTHVANAKVVVE